MESSLKCVTIDGTMAGNVCDSFVKSKGKKRLLPPRRVEINQKKCLR